MVAPPVARKVPRELVEDGDVRVDNYYWLRDGSRSNSDVVAHLHAENDYTMMIFNSDSSEPEMCVTGVAGKIQSSGLTAGCNHAVARSSSLLATMTMAIRSRHSP